MVLGRNCRLTDRGNTGSRQPGLYHWHQKVSFNSHYSTRILGFIGDSEKLSFLIPARKIESFTALREDILAHKSWVDLKTLQRFQGKCVFFSLAVPAARLFISEMSSVCPVRGLEIYFNVCKLLGIKLAPGFFFAR